MSGQERHFWVWQRGKSSEFIQRTYADNEVDAIMRLHSIYPDTEGGTFGVVEGPINFGSHNELLHRMLDYGKYFMIKRTVTVVRVDND